MNKALTTQSNRYSLYFPFIMALILSTILPGCASLAPMNSANSNATRNPYQDNLSINGKIHVQYQQAGKDQSLPGNFEWLQSDTDTNITLLSQLGQTIAIINQNASGASLQQANQPTRFASDVDALLSETLGWPLPLLGLRDWLQGYALNQEGKRVAIAANDSQKLTANGWQIRYVNWQTDAGMTYPKRIDLQRYTTQAGEVTIRIAMEPWKTP